MKNKKSHEILFLITILILLIILIIIFSYKIYAFITEEKEIENNENVETVAKEDDILITTATKEEENIIAEENNKNSQVNIDNSTQTTSNGDTYSKIAILNIPSLGIKYEVLSKTTDALMKISLTKYWGPEPNEPGNFCIIGHNYRNTKFFSKLLNIKKDAIVELTDLSGKTLQYKVYDMYLVHPDDNSCTSQLNEGHTDVTLITCTNDGKQRFVVKARAY